MTAKKNEAAFRPGDSRACEALSYEVHRPLRVWHARGTNGREDRRRQHRGRLGLSEAMAARFRGHVGAVHRLDYFAVRNAAGLSRFPGMVELHG